MAALAQPSTRTRQSSEDLALFFTSTSTTPFSWGVQTKASIQSSSVWLKFSVNPPGVAWSPPPNPTKTKSRRGTSRTTSCPGTSRSTCSTRIRWRGRWRRLRSYHTGTSCRSTIRWRRVIRLPMSRIGSYRSTGFLVLRSRAALLPSSKTLMRRCSRRWLCLRERKRSLIIRWIFHWRFRGARLCMKTRTKEVMRRASWLLRPSWRWTCLEKANFILFLRSLELLYTIRSRRGSLPWCSGPWEMNSIRLFGNSISSVSDSILVSVVATVHHT